MIRIDNVPASYDGLTATFRREHGLPRIWAHDYAVWKPTPREITNRLGWLHAPFSMVGDVERLRSFAEAIRSDGFRHVLLLGMGGSSLAAETFARIFGAAPGFPSLTVLDSTHPQAVSDVERRLDLSRTLIVVSTKSGTTAETLSLFRYLYGRLLEAGRPSPGSRFVAITDPGSPLVDLAADCGFRETFLNDPNIGGRYSALSLFGLVPAALLGIDIERLLERARAAAVRCASDDPQEPNPAAQLGLLLAACALDGRDKATFLLSPEIAAFGDWVEQLIAESAGKEGVGILPVIGEPIGSVEAYGDDRIFVVLASPRASREEKAIAKLGRTGNPIVHIQLEDPYELGEQLFVWEIAIAIAGHVLKINPFDQPNVESAKILARRAIDAFRRTGSLPPSESVPLSVDPLCRALDGAAPPTYCALQAYLPPSDALTGAFAALQGAVRDRFGVATTFGYGPRFLHSTGQLHKGDGGHGRFVQFVGEHADDRAIPDEAGSGSSSLTFGTLISAQAAGDRQALLEAGRPVTTLAVPADPTDAIRRIADEILSGCDR